VSQRTRQLARQAEQLPAADISEDQFQAWVIERATAAGWVLQFHVRRAKVKGRWVTNTSSAGVPDLWLLRPSTGQLVVLELKAWDGKPSDEQKRWVAGLQKVAGVEAYIVSPRDADAVLRLLARPRS